VAVCEHAELEEEFLCDCGTLVGVQLNKHVAMCSKEKATHKDTRRISETVSHMAAHLLLGTPISGSSVPAHQFVVACGLESEAVVVSSMIARLLVLPIARLRTDWRRLCSRYRRQCSSNSHRRRSRRSWGARRCPTRPFAEQSSCLTS
jgi:hypothetical protein